MGGQSVHLKEELGTRAAGAIIQRQKRVSIASVLSMRSRILMDEPADEIAGITNPLWIPSCEMYRL